MTRFSLNLSRFRLYFLHNRKGDRVSKRTEKIEIRVTPEEKKTLVDLARSENRTLSALIRSIIETYVATEKSGATAQETRITNMLTSKKNWTIAGIFTSALAFATLTLPAQADSTYQITMDIKDFEESTGQTSTYNWSHQLKSSGAAETPFIVTVDSGTTYEISIALDEQDDASVFAQFSICKMDGATCSPVAAPSMIFTKQEPAKIEIGSVILTAESEVEQLVDGISIEIAHSNM